MPTATDASPGTVAVIGAGAMGAMYADHLARVGIRTLIVADADRARRLREEPLTVNGRRLDIEVLDPFDTADGMPEVDLVLVAVKHAHLADAVRLAAPLVGPATTVLSVLNGLDSEDIILAGLRAAGVEVNDEQVPLCIALAMDAQRAGAAVRYTQAGRLVFGPADGPVTAGITRIQELLTRAGLAWSTPDDMRHQMWWKFMVNVGINQASAVLRAPYGAFQEPGPAYELMMALIEETRAVAAAEGVDLTDGDVERWRTVLAGQPVAGMTSMHQDVLAGRETEVAIFAGRVVDIGGEHGIPVPHNQTMLWILTARSSDQGEA
ncbi:MAG TPA: ketopantoate reductase family protein [Intrasporangiaceae bacterium]|nr:ketopantoate reductase family protein [Intrasporangiaceae bacterium]